MANTYQVIADPASVVADPSGNGNIIITLKLVRLSDSVVVETKDVPSSDWDVVTAQYQATIMVKNRLAKDALLVKQAPLVTNLKAYLTANPGALATG